MASKETINCLLRAIDALQVRGADEADMGRVRRSLKSSVKTMGETKTDADLIMAMQHRADMAYHSLVADRLAETGYLERLPEFMEGRFDVENARTARQKATAARALRQEVSALAGNRGSRGEATLDSLLAYETMRLSGRMAKILQFITDQRGAIKDSEMAATWLKEVLGQDTGNAEAKTLAKDFHNITFEILNRLKKARVLVEKVENWFPQTHDWGRIQSNLTEWKQFLLKHLDRSKHPDAEAAIEALQSAVSRQEYEGETPGRLGLGRKFWLDSPEAQFEYQMKFGRGNISGTVLSTIHRFASEVTMAEKFSAKPTKLLTERARQMQEDLAKFPAKTVKDTFYKKRAQADLQRAVNLVKHQQMQTSAPTLQTLENTLLAAREAYAAMFLGKVPGSIITEDVWNSAWQGRHLSGGFMNSVQERFNTFVDVVNNTGNAKDIAIERGWYQHGFVANASASRFSLAAGPEFSLDVTSGSRLDKVVAGSQQARIATNRITYASALEQNMRATNITANQRGLGRLVAQDWDQVDTRLRRLVLKSNGITSKDWEVLQKVGMDKEDMTFDIERLANQNPKLYRKVGAMLVREGNLQTIMPDMETRYLLSGMIPAGAPRQAVTTMTQFLSWPLSIWRNAIARDLRSGVPDFLIGAGGYTVMAAFKIQLYALAAGGVGATYLWDSPTLWYRAFLHSATMGPVLPLMVEGFTEGEMELPGIVPQNIIRTGNQLGKAVGNAVFDDETDAAAAQAVKTFSNFIPNWWFIDGVTNHVVESITADLDPQRARARERRLEREGRRGEQ